MSIALRSYGNLLRQLGNARPRVLGISPHLNHTHRPLLACLTQSRNMRIMNIPMWTGTSDNYAYLIIDDKTQDAMIVDPANPREVLPRLSDVRITGIINTHHHRDHTGGNRSMLDAYPTVGIIGGSQCPLATRQIEDQGTFKIGENIAVKALHTPCHTQDSICYYAQDGDEKAVFTGDTLFHAGCGRFFEGTSEEMHKALNTTLASLPDDTKVYPGHEYTKSNTKFGLHILPNDPHLKQLAVFCERNNETTGRFTIGDEKRHNVFMRVEDPEVQAATGTSNPVEAMGVLREKKNSFS